MAIKNFIQQVQQATKGRPKSTEWYRDKIKEFGTPKTLDLIRDGKQAKSPFGGRLNMFVYAPKFARKLPYYDTFPLVLPLTSSSSAFNLTAVASTCSRAGGRISSPCLHRRLSSTSVLGKHLITHKASSR